MNIDKKWMQEELKKAQEKLNKYHIIFDDKEREQKSKEIEIINKKIKEIEPKNKEAINKRNELINERKNKWCDYNKHYSKIFLELNKDKPKLFNEKPDGNSFLLITSPLEYAFALVLEILKIKYECQFKIGDDSGKFDFYIPLFNVLIELDGNEYHQNNRKFDCLKTREAQKKRCYFFRYVASDVYSHRDGKSPVYFSLVVKNIADDLLDLSSHDELRNKIIELEKISNFEEVE